MHGFHKLLHFVKNKNIRNGDILVVKRRDDVENEDMFDYYDVTQKDFISQIDGTCLFDNYYLFDLLENYVFDVKFGSEKK